MASLSSTNSVSGANSLGNTSLRGFGGMVSGIDRDSIIEAMTQHANNRVIAQQAAITKLEWKQGAYQSITDKILDLSDNYLSYSSGKSLVDSTIFDKNVITVHGRDESTCFVKATGTSELADNLSITSVRQLATSSMRESDSFSAALQTNLKDLDTEWVSSSLEGTQLVFGIYNSDGTASNETTFTFAGSYEYRNDAENKTETRTINYMKAETETDEEFYTRLSKQLNEMMESNELSVGESKLSESVEFVVKRDASNNAVGITIQEKAGASATGIGIRNNSTALKALGYEDTGADSGATSKGISLTDFRDKQTVSFNDSAFNRPTALEYMTGQKLTFNYDGNKKDIVLVTEEEAKNITSMDDFADNLQKRLNHAFGEGAVTVTVGADGLSFTARNDSASGTSSTVSITSGNTELLHNLGIANGESSKVNLDGKLTQSALKGKLGNDTDAYVSDGELDLVINGVKIKGLTADSSIRDILSQINASDAGVKATYSDTSGQFMLVSSETGKGRKIELGSDLAEKLFGRADGTGFKEGQNAVITVNYGSGDVTLDRSSNTFDLEGLNVTVSGVFGGKYDDTEPLEGNFKVDGMTGERIFYKEDGTEVQGDKTLSSEIYKDADGNLVNYKGNRVTENGAGGYDLVYNKEWKPDTSAAVTFSAAADVDGTTERVKEFVEAFNELAKEINKQITTRPDNSYGVLTDAQKAEMTSEEIEKWEAKAKEGILYGDSTMRGLSTDIQGIFSALMSNGVDYADLEKIGITYSDDYLDGGTLVFNETAFKNAMNSDPELVSNIITGGGNVTKGLATVVDEAFTPYATRYASKNASDGSKGSYGALIEIAGTSKKATTLVDNQIYTQLKTMNETLASLKETLKMQQERYISQFTYMEGMINQFNSQSSYLSQISG